MGSITFENMFEYSKATFDIVIDEDWKSKRPSSSLGQWNSGR